jgi:hypothetical protein
MIDARRGIEPVQPPQGALLVIVDETRCGADEGPWTPRHRVAREQTAGASPIRRVIFQQDRRRQRLTHGVEGDPLGIHLINDIDPITHGLFRAWTRLLTGFPLADTGNPVISLVTKAHEISQGLV